MILLFTRRLGRKRLGRKRLSSETSVYHTVKFYLLNKSKKIKEE